MKKLGNLIFHYLLFFALVAFLITCCMSLFIKVLAGQLDIVFTEENLGAAAKLTFANVMLLSLIFTSIDGYRRKHAVSVPAKRIAEAADKVVQGDFSVRVEHVSPFVNEETFNDIIDSFNKMTEELAGVETLRTDFIANVSHEMKTPLAVIKNYGTLLQNPNLSKEERIEYAKGVENGARRLSDMMTNILKLNRLENQQIFPQKEAYYLGEQLCECLLQYENVWEEKDIEIDTDIDENVIVKADAELLSLVWNNLLSNAFKFTEPGGRVSLSLTSSGQYAEIKVKDTGCGMSPEVGKHIFDKFYQGDTSHSVQGNGLGLALVKRVIDIVQGEIEVESAKGIGTTFTVRIKKE